jgi:hypothetical protein
MLSSVFCFGDSVTTLKNLGISLVIRPNDGTGDNLGGFITGSNVNLEVGGGTPVFWFSGIDEYAPGSPGGGFVNIFFDDASGTIGKHTYDESSLTPREADFNAAGFTFPTDGRTTFTVSVPGVIGVIVLTGCDDKGCITYNAYTNPGTLTMSFTLFDGFYVANSASFVSTAVAPEPSTLGLLVIGLGALPWRKYLKRRSSPAKA